MKPFHFALLGSAVLLSFSAYSVSASAKDSTKVISKVGDEADDSTVTIEKTKGTRNLRPNYEIVAGEDEISGDPTAGTKEAFKSWKEACAEWKKELKENNKDGQVLVASCGKATFAKDEASGAGAGIYTYRSNANYKLKTRITDK